MTWLWVLAVSNVLLLLQNSSLREKVAKVDRKLEVVLDRFEGLRLYLYEIDPQFEDERASNEKVWAEDAHPLDMAEDAALITRKKEDGRRTLNSPLESLEGPNRS